MTTQLHRQLVADVVSRHGARDRGFGKALRGALSELRDAAPEVPRIAPDAWRAGDDDVFTVWEVEVTYQVPEAKLHTYGRLWADLDYSGGPELALFTVDRYGVEREVDLVSAYYGWLTKIVANRR